jgi:hypothetical protein
VLVSTENAALKRRSSTVVRAGVSSRKPRAAQKFNERVHGENSLMLSWEGKSAEVLRLALGRYASSRVAQDDKQITWAAADR